MQELGVKKTTFYKLVKEYENDFKIKYYIIEETRLNKCFNTQKGDSSPTYFWATPCTKLKWEMNRLE